MNFIPKKLSLVLLYTLVISHQCKAAVSLEHPIGQEKQYAQTKERRTPQTWRQYVYNDIWYLEYYGLRLGLAAGVIACIIAPSGTSAQDRISRIIEGPIAGGIFSGLVGSCSGTIKFCIAPGEEPVHQSTIEHLHTPPTTPVRPSYSPPSSIDKGKTSFRL